eukprot:821054-Pelagomonas_calceolata.AAC.3
MALLFQELPTCIPVWLPASIPVTNSSNGRRMVCWRIPGNCQLVSDSCHHICAGTTQAIATPPAPPKTTPREWTTQDVSKVALKDVPLKSLYPDEPAPPKPVSCVNGPGRMSQPVDSLSGFQWNPCYKASVLSVSAYMGLQKCLPPNLAKCTCPGCPQDACGHCGQWTGWPVDSSGAARPRVSPVCFLWLERRFPHRSALVLTDVILNLQSINAPKRAYYGCMRWTSMTSAAGLEARWPHGKTRMATTLRWARDVLRHWREQSSPGYVRLDGDGLAARDCHCSALSLAKQMCAALLLAWAGQHALMGLHVFFGCYHNLFRLMAKCGVLENLLVKEHTHTFCNNDGDVRELDFRFEVGGQKIGAPFHDIQQSQLLNRIASPPSNHANTAIHTYGTYFSHSLVLSCSRLPPPLARERYGAA